MTGVSLYTVLAALKVILFGACISVPAIAGYTVFSHRVFRGKNGELKYA